MAKSKITVTVDEDILEQARRLSDTHLSSVVNDALTAHVRRLARQAALAELLTEWNEQDGHVSEDDMHDARAAFDELDGVSRRRDIA